MKKQSKRVEQLKTLVREDSYAVNEAVNLLKQLGTAKFIESVEAHISLSIDPKYANQQLRTSLVLPNGTGNSIRIAVLTEADYVEEVMKMGADVVGADDLLEEIGNGNLNFDLLITTPQLMPKLAKMGRALGPKGLMPSPKSGTVTTDLKATIDEFKKGKLEYRADKTGIVHLNFGKVSFSEQQLQENLVAVFESIERNKPSGVKGRYFKSFNVCTSMSPSVNIELASFRKV